MSNVLDLELFQKQFSFSVLSEYSTAYYSVNNKLSLVENDCECGVSRDEQNQGASGSDCCIIITFVKPFKKVFIKK